ncbi:MAG: NAD-dependent epimerase/dehydratase family protein [Candidatus Micrarchaeales archaeon]
MEDISGKNILVTGGAGFIGSNLVELFMSKNANVTVIDNLSDGKIEFLDKFMKKKNFKFEKIDVLDKEKVEKCMKEHEIQLVAHLAAKSDVAQGTKITDLDLKQGTVATYNVLESMRKNDVKDIMFSSSSVVYGYASVKPTPENYGPLAPISLYGASKLAAEGLISAFSHLFGMRYYIYRYANIVGKNSTHGVVLDFKKRLKENPKELTVFGDGKQRKSYLDVVDCVDGMLYIYQKSKSNENIFNLATDDQMQVSDIVKVAIEKFSPGAKIKYTGGAQGWPGDVPDAWLSNKKMKEIGFEPKMKSSRDAVLNLVNLLA